MIENKDLLCPNKLERQVPIALAGRDRVVFCNADVHRGMTGRKVATWGSPSPDASDGVVFVLTHALQTGMPLHWKHNLDAIGGFRAEMPPCEDPDLHLRLACAGLQFQHIPERLITLRRARGTLSDADPALMRDLELRMVQEAYRSVKENGALTSERAEAFAGFVTKVARRCLQHGLRDRANQCFAFALEIHPDGGIPQAYGRWTRRLNNRFGPAITERLVGLKRLMSKRPV